MSTPIPPTLEKRVERLERAVETMAYWLVSAQTGFNRKDADGIYAILRGDWDGKDIEDAKKNGA